MPVNTVNPLRVFASGCCKHVGIGPGFSAHFPAPAPVQISGEEDVSTKDSPHRISKVEGLGHEVQTVSLDRRGRGPSTYDLWRDECQDLVNCTTGQETPGYGSSGLHQHRGDPLRAEKLQRLVYVDASISLGEPDDVDAALRKLTDPLRRRLIGTEDDCATLESS